MTILAIYLGAGLLAGFLAGLVGIGGGLILVPGLAAAFLYQGLPESQAFPMAVATSLATIPFTAFASVRAHNAHGAVDWAFLKPYAPGVFAGSLLGTALVPLIPAPTLRTAFAIYVVLAAVQMLFDFSFKPLQREPPRRVVTIAGAGVGVVCSLVGVGGAILSIPLMVLSRLSFRSAIGTASAAGFPAAVAGTLGYIGAGYASHVGAGASLGYIHLPALAGVVAASVFAAKLGARASHKLPVPMLKRIFGLVLVGIAIRMLVSLA